MTCQFLQDGLCDRIPIVADLPSAVFAPSDEACDACHKTDTPLTGETNAVLASLAIQAVAQHAPGHLADTKLRLSPYLSRIISPARPAGPCPHLQDWECRVVAGLMDRESPQPVTLDTCRHCSQSCPPRAPNRVTAAAALRLLRQDDPEHMPAHRERLAKWIQCGGVPDYVRLPAAAAKTGRLLLKCDLCPGDVATMTAAVYSLAQAYPGRWRVQVHTSASEIWDHNPDIVTHPDDASDVLPIDMHCPSIHHSNQRHLSFLGAYTRFLETALGVPIPLATNRPQLYLSDQERSWMSQVAERVGGRHVRYWVFSSGVKDDYPAKQWPIEHYREVVRRTRHRIEWVQVGLSSHDHPEVPGAIDLRGQTSLRELIRLVYHAEGGVGPVTFLQHLCAAWEKPYICLLGGREPVPWTAYPLQTTLHTLGALDCCRHAACWKSRIMPQTGKSDDSLCQQPVTTGERPVGRCMQLISPSEVVSILERYQ